MLNQAPGVTDIRDYATKTDGRVVATKASSTVLTNMVGVTSYGRNDYNDSASIIGKKHGGTWHIFAQEYINLSKQVTAVKRIFP